MNDRTWRCPRSWLTFEVGQKEIVMGGAKFVRDGSGFKCRHTSDACARGLLRARYRNFTVNISTSP